MSSIPTALRERIAETARGRCGYCLTQEAVVGMPMEIDLIVPEAAGGTDGEDNLWLACPRCNRYNGARTHAVDPETGESVSLFNPRVQVWGEHFAWTAGGVVIEGLTPIGRAPIAALDMNNRFVLRARRVWVLWGWHPPED